LGPANFYPPPRVNSVVLRLEPARPEPQAQDENLFSRVVKAAFAQRRKTLKNTLVAKAAHLGLQPQDLLAVVQDIGINPGHRAETLSVRRFVDLSNRIGEKMQQAGPASGAHPA
jgi:16S rRNA (adenine1518-N6/adenine1519-N6)-dimethyltransferase